MNVIAIIVTLVKWTFTILLPLCLGYGIKFFAVFMICKHPELTDEKVKCITNMVSKISTSKFDFSAM